jgi:hypothetical protein
MAAEPVDIAERLSAIAEELTDLSMDRLRRASEAVQSGEDPDRVLLAEEKRITRARRAVERAAAALVGPGALRDGAEEGP